MVAGTAFLLGGTGFVVGESGVGASDSQHLPLDAYFLGSNVTAPIDRVDSYGLSVRMLSSTSASEPPTLPLPPVQHGQTGGTIVLRLLRPASSGGLNTSSIRLYRADGVVLSTSSFAQVADVVMGESLEGAFTMNDLAANLLYSFFAIPMNAASYCSASLLAESAIIVGKTSSPSRATPILNLRTMDSCTSCPNMTSGGAILMVLCVDAMLCVCDCVGGGVSE